MKNELQLPKFKDLEYFKNLQNLTELELAKKILKKILITIYNLNWIENFEESEPYCKSDADCLFEAFDKVLKIIKKLENREKK